MTIRNAMQALALVTIAAMVLPVAAGAVGEERCYGIARAGENDGIGSGEGNGASSVDFQGNVWGVSFAGSNAYRANPTTGAVDVYGGLIGAYTYSDMTGHALSTVGGGGIPTG